MEMTIENMGSEYYSHRMESDIIDFKWTSEFGLKVTISTWRDIEQQIGIEYLFSDFNGFQFLDEGDLLGYWKMPDFRNGYHLYRIIKGGWKSGQITQNGILDVSSAIIELKEYFIATTNGCLTVLAYEKPLISEIELKD